METEIQLQKANSDNIDNNCNDSAHKNMEQKVDILEQKLKNNNIRLIGVKEVHGEDVFSQVKNIFTDKLNIPVTDEIASVYRFGKKNKEKSRHIIVSFKEVNFKNIIIGKKKLLKGTRIIMKEDLTNERWKLVRESSDIYGFKNVFTFNGAVFVKSGTSV